MNVIGSSEPTHTPTGGDDPLRSLGSVVHGHHIVQKTVPKLYDEVKDKTWKWLEKHGTDKQKEAWLIGETHKLLKETLKMTDADLAIGKEGFKAAQQLAKDGKMPANLTLAINDGKTHSWETMKTVYDKLKTAKSKEEAEEFLRDFGKDFMNGVRVVLD